MHLISKINLKSSGWTTCQFEIQNLLDEKCPREVFEHFEILNPKDILNKFVRMIAGVQVVSAKEEKKFKFWRSDCSFSECCRTL